jgi:uncharacterized protein
MPPNYRRCVSCRKLAHRSNFWRVVRVFPSHQLQLDQGMGRSVYLCPEASCLKLAQKKDRLGRSLKLAVPESFYQALWQQLDCLADSAPESICPNPDKTHSANV